MNKDFIENCKLLKSHFTKLTQAQRNTTTTTQSKFDYESSSTAATINRAEQLLFLDRIDLLDKIDIEDIKQHALLKYATKTNRLCEKNSSFQWNDEIYCTPSLPYNKEKVLIFKDGSESANDDQYVIKKEEVLEKIEKLEEASKVTPKKKIDGTEVIVKNINQEKKELEVKKIKTTPVIEKPKKPALQTETPNLIEIKYNPGTPDPITPCIHNCVNAINQMPELKIIPQQQININTILEVKKITLSDDETEKPTQNEIKEPEKTPNHVPEEPAKKRPPNKKRDSHSSKINSFIENVEKFQKFKQEKSKSFVNLAESKTASARKPSYNSQRQNKSLVSLHDKLTSYAHRFKAQKSIIEMQKEKLIEQNKLIAELKLTKMQEQLKESLESAQKELRKISPKQQHKVKILLDDSDRKGDAHATLNATLKLSKAPKMLQHMADRAKEREERRLLINERKRLLDEEKQRILERQMKKKLEEEQVEKNKRLAKLKEQREQFRLAELQKQELKQHYLQMNEIALQHYKKKLKKRAIESFKMVIYRIRIKHEIGIRFYDNNIVIKYFKIWCVNVKKLHDYKTFVAKRFFKKMCYKKCMKIWRESMMESIQQNQVAIDRYEMSLQHNMFMAWLNYIRECKIQFNINAKKADLHYNRTVLYQYIHSWRSLPAILAIERVQLERKRKWRLRVAQILTDYDPLKSEIN